MKATIAPALVAGLLALGTLAAIGGEAGAQGKPETGRTPEVLAPRLQQRPEHAPSPQRPDEQAPGDDAPSAQDETPASPGGCPNPGRPLQLIV